MLKLVKDLKVTKIVTQIKLEEVWGNLEVKNYFRKQSCTKYVSQTLVFM